MLRDDVIQGLLNEALPYSLIEEMLDQALRYGESLDNAYNYRVINTNAGMPAEYCVVHINQ